jgi:hypothetical protein
VSEKGDVGVAVAGGTELRLEVVLDGNRIFDVALEADVAVDLLAVSKEASARCALWRSGST